MRDLNNLFSRLERDFSVNCKIHGFSIPQGGDALSLVAEVATMVAKKELTARSQVDAAWEVSRATLAEVRNAWSKWGKKSEKGRYFALIAWTAYAVKKECEEVWPASLFN